MKPDSQNFGILLNEGMLAIQKRESTYKKKKLSDIQEELGRAINRQASTIEWYRKDHIPSSQFELEQLAREIFKRGQIGTDWLERFLKCAGHSNWVALRDELCIPGTSVPEQDEDYLYKRTKLYLFKQVLVDGFSETLTQSEIHVTADSPLSTIRRRVIDLSRPIEQFELSFQQGHREDGGEVTARVLVTHDQICVWAIEFEPPLKKGQKAAYSYKTFGRYYASTAEEVEKQFKDGKRSKNFEFWSIKADAPTDELEMQILFPFNYPLTLPPTGGFSVYAGSHEQFQEKDLIISNNGFAANFDQNLQRWIMKLHISSAHFGHSYELQWVPPRG